MNSGGGKHTAPQHFVAAQHILCYFLNGGFAANAQYLGISSLNLAAGLPAVLFRWSDDIALY